MPGTNKLILDASLYRIFLNVPNVATGGGPFTALPIETGKSLEWTEQAENSIIHAIGSVTGIGNQNVAYKYSVRLGLQAGEYLSILATKQVKSAIKFPGFILGITALDGTFNMTFLQCLIHNVSTSFDAKSPETPTSLDISAVDLV